MPAHTYQEEHWYTGKMKTRCCQCKKVAYATEEIAQFRATQISERQPMQHYLGTCGWWHVTRGIKKKRRY